MGRKHLERRVGNKEGGPDAVSKYVMAEKRLRLHSLCNLPEKIYNTKCWSLKKKKYWSELNRQGRFYPRLVQPGREIELNSTETRGGRFLKLWNELGVKFWRTLREDGLM